MIFCHKKTSYWVLGLTAFFTFLGIRNYNQYKFEEQKRYKDPFELSGKKVHLEDEIGNELSHVAGGTSLAVLIDEACMSKAANGNSGLLASEGQKNLPFKRSSVQTHKITLNKGTSRKEIEESANRNPCVKGVSINRLASLNDLAGVNDDPMTEKQSHLNTINTLKAYDILYSPSHGIKSNVTIAIIDNGIDLEHKDLKSNLWVNKREFSGVAGVDDDNNGFIDDIHGYNFVSQIGSPEHETTLDHGTHVAGLAAAVIANGFGGRGVMGKNAKIMILNVFGHETGADTVNIDNAIRYAADNGANVINLSLGGRGRSDTTAAAIVYALNKGAIVVAAAGNNGKDMSGDFYYMASYSTYYPGLISVAALDIADGNAAYSSICEISNFSNQVVKVGAPGCDTRALNGGLLSTRRNNQFGYKKGTSMAAPLVAATAGFIISFITDRTGHIPSPAETEALLIKSLVQDVRFNDKITSGRVLNLEAVAKTLSVQYPKPALF